MINWGKSITEQLLLRISLSLEMRILILIIIKYIRFRLEFLIFWFFDVVENNGSYVFQWCNFQFWVLLNHMFLWLLMISGSDGGSIEVIISECSCVNIFWGIVRIGSGIYSLSSLCLCLEILLAIQVLIEFLWNFWLLNYLFLHRICWSLALSTWWISHYLTFFKV